MFKRVCELLHVSVPDYCAASQIKRGHSEQKQKKNGFRSKRCKKNPRVHKYLDQSMQYIRRVPKQYKLNLISLGSFTSEEICAYFVEDVTT